MTTDQASDKMPLRKLTAQEFIDIITEVDIEKYAEFYEYSCITIKNVEIAEGITLTKNVIVNSSLIIESGTFRSEFRIEDCEFKEELRIRGGEFKEGFWIEGSNFKDDFRIEGGEFSRDFGIGNSTFDKDFKIEGGKFKGLLFIDDGIFCREFTVGNSTFEREIVFMAGYACILRVDYVISTFRLMVSVNCHINSLILSQTLPKDSLLQISCNLYYLAFENFQNFGSITFNGLSFFNQPYAPKGVLLPDDYDRPERSELQISNSDLGKTVFIGCDLSGFALEFRSSKITDVFVTGTKMPDHITTKDNERRLDYPQHQLGYSQIKKIYEARGDRVEANRYYAREMEAYQQTLSWRRWKDLGEKLNLSANKISTNYGQSWGLGLIMTLLVSAIFFILYCDALGYQNAEYTNDSIDLFLQICSYFPEFLNPIHKPDYVAQQLLNLDDKHLSAIPGCARVIEAVSRIFIAYFVYQLIQAFRKHGKASG